MRDDFIAKVFLSLWRLNYYWCLFHSQEEEEEELKREVDFTRNMQDRTIFLDRV